MKRMIIDRPALWVPTPGCSYSTDCFKSGLRAHCDSCVRNKKRPERDEFAPITQEAI
jgi:hypothetical protein